MKAFVSTIDIRPHLDGAMILNQHESAGVRKDVSQRFGFWSFKNDKENL